MINKRLTPRIVVILLLTLFVTQISTKHLFGLNNSRTILSSPSQSFPTRTSTPGSNPPTKTPAPKPTSSDGGDGSATAVPTSTSQSSTANTATPPVTIAYTPVGGFVPTAESCGVPPTIKVQNPTNVRQGPGTDYPVVGQLVFLEVRFILGRAADTAWWLIQLDDAAGWVADNVVTIEGYIGGVPIVPAPEINGQTPTPGTLWNPTPLPFCTVTPTTTAVPSATPSPTTAVIEATPIPGSSESEEETLESIPSTETQTAVPEPTQTAVAPPTLPPAPATTQPEVITAAQAAFDPVESAPSGSAADWLLPVAGLLLIGGGVATFITRRKNQEQ